MNIHVCPSDVTVNPEHLFNPNAFRQVPAQAKHPAGGREPRDGVPAGGQPPPRDHLVQGREEGRGDQQVGRGHRKGGRRGRGF